MNLADLFTNRWRSFSKGKYHEMLRGFNDQCGLHMTSRAVFLVSRADLDHAMWKACVGQDDFSEICSSLGHFNVDKNAPYCSDRPSGNLF